MFDAAARFGLFCRPLLFLRVMPAASILLLAIAVLLTALAVAGYLRAGRLLAQHRAWLVIAVIFVVVSVGVGLLS